MREVLNTNLSKLESESLELKQKTESLICENRKLFERLKKAESDLIANRSWNSSSQALNWLNTHYNRNKKGLGFVTKQTVGLLENIICFHYGKTKHYCYACPLRKYAIERNLIHVKQIWIRKDVICMSKGIGRKWIWLPKTNPNLFCRLK